MEEKLEEKGEEKIKKMRVKNIVREVKNFTKGFTLMELMVAMVVIGLALLGMLAANIYVQQTSERAYERMVATQDAQRVLELMRSAAEANPPFPANVAGFCGNTAGTVPVFNNIPNEQVVVTCANPDADPLNVIVTTNWREQGIRNASIQLSTLMTRRL